MMAEWESCGAVLLAMPHADSDWNSILPRAIAQYRRLLAALTANGENCILLAPDAAEALEMLSAPLPSGELGAYMSDDQLKRISIVEMPTNDTWTRDYGPISAVRCGRLRALDFGFNAWGLKFAADRDNLVNRRLAEKLVIRPDAYRNESDFILEGGSVETDGQGTLLTTSKCLLSPNRNGGLSKAEAGEELSRRLGVDHILWLDYGHLEGDDTDSHIDTLCRMAPGNTILFTGCRNMDDPHFEDLLHMRAQLTLFRTAEGNPYNLVELPLPDPVYNEEGDRLPATYANYLVTEKCIYMPVYNQPANDRLACQTVRVAFPDHKVVPVECTTLLEQHGSLHCSTMQLARGLVLEGQKETR